MRLAPSCALLVVLAAGCSHTVPLLRESLVAEPQRYQRVAVLPIWFDGSTTTDESLGTNDVHALNGIVAKNTTRLLTQTFGDKGYTVTAPVRYLDDNGSVEPVDATSSAALDAIRTEFLQVSSEVDTHRQSGTSDGDSRQSFQFDEHILVHDSAVLEELGIDGSDAVVLMRTSINLETPAQRRKRLLWNWTGGVLLMPVAFAATAAMMPVGTPFWPSEGRVEHTLAIVDTTSGAVMFYNRRALPGVDARDESQLRSTIVDLLAKLPNQIAPSESEPVFHR